MHDKSEKELSKDIFLQHSTNKAELSGLLSISAHSAFKSIVKGSDNHYYFWATLQDVKCFFQSTIVAKKQKMFI